MRAQRRSLSGLVLVAVALVLAAAGPLHAGGHHGHGGGHHHGHVSVGFYPGYYGGWGWYGWGGPWWGYPSYAAYAPVVAEGAYGTGMGALDLDIGPENAEVYVDGSYVGKADDYDGFPTYLWLDRGTYDIVFYLDGYETLARQYVIRTGQLTDVGDRLRPGESVRPENLAAKTTVHREARLAREDEREAEAAALEAEQAAAYEAATEAVDDDRDWEERAPQRRIVVEAEDVEDDDDEVEDADAAPVPAPTQGLLGLDVNPRDASVYLDGMLVGSAASLAGRDPLRVLPGEHTVDVVRPGHRAVKQHFEVVAGENLTLEITLSKD